MVTERKIEAARKAAPPFWRDTDQCEKHIAKMLHVAEGVKPRIKPLEWWRGLNSDVFAVTICGTYSIQAYAAFAALQLPGQKIRDCTNWLTIAEAKAAAQADYEARILSALTTEGE